MIFYFIAHVSIAVIVANSSNLFIRSKAAPYAYPICLKTFLIINSFDYWYCFPIITFVIKIGWTLIVKLILGAFVSGMFPITYRIALTITGPILLFVMSGALLKFWYITDGMLTIMMLACLEFHYF